MATQKGRNWSSGDIVTAANLNLIERGVSAVAEEYTPTTWANGNTVTAAALNNIEQGIVNAGGGSGSGDFSTATIRFINSGGSGTSYTVTIAEIIDESGSSGIFYDEETVVGERTAVVPLYKGTYCFDPMLGTNNADYSVMPTCTGDAEFTPDGFIITGDCTITFVGTNSGGGGTVIT